MDGCTVYQLAHQSHTQMMSFVVITDGGDLVVIDGGTRADAAFLLETMREVTGTTKPRVSAWFLTHPHLDHVDALFELYERHSGDFSVATIYHRFPDPEFIQSAEPKGVHTLLEYREAAKRFAFPEEILETGRIVSVGPMEFKVLLACTDPIQVNAINNSSTVLRMECGDVSMVFLGDLGIEGGQRLLGTTGRQDMKADIVQLAHHGQNGVGFPVYEAISPSLALWCTPQWLWDNNQGDRGPGSGPWTVEETKAWLRELKVADQVVSKDGSFAISLKNRGYRITPYGK